MFDQLLQSFTQSNQGQRALAQLQGQGYTPQQATGILSAALPAAARAMQGSLGGAAVGTPGAMPTAMPGMPGMPGAPAQGGMGAMMGAVPGMGALAGLFGGGAAGAGAPAGAQGAGVMQQLTQVGNSGYAMNFLSAAVSGMVRGQGIKNSAIDGLQGVVGGHVAEVIAAQFGLPRRVAGVAGAVVTPLMVDFLWEKFQGGGLSSMFSGAGGDAGASGAGGGFGGFGGFGGGGGGHTPPRFSGWGRQGG